MSVQTISIPDQPDAKPSLAIAVRISSKKGFQVQYVGIRRFDLTGQTIAEVVAEIATPGFKWKDPKFGKMKSALTIAVDQPNSALIFVLDDMLDAEFSNSLPAIFVSDIANAQRLCNVQTWPDLPGPHGGPTIASVMTLLDEGEGDVEFALALDNVGKTHPDQQPYRTPIIIDPDVPWPYPNGGAG